MSVSLLIGYYQSENEVLVVTVSLLHMQETTARYIASH